MTAAGLFVKAWHTAASWRLSSTRSASADRRSRRAGPPDRKTMDGSALAAELFIVFPPAEFV
jgi:hypothetical protein